MIEPGNIRPGVLLTAFSRALFETIATSGINTWVISPGSRSTPFVLALQHLQQRYQLELHSVIDERAAGFFALGLAQSRGENHGVGLLCTSGSAAAHYFPSVIEASLALIPLIILTADRPERLQNCASPQTIYQQGLYGSFVRTSLNLEPDAALERAKDSLNKVSKAIRLSRSAYPGPIHLNLQADKPLEECEPDTQVERLFCTALRDAAQDQSHADTPPIQLEGFRSETEALQLSDAICLEGALVSVGPLPQSIRRSLQSWCLAHQIPFIDELPGSHAASFEYLAQAESSMPRLGETRLIHFGPPPITTTGQQFLEKHAESLMIRSHGSPGDFTTKAFDSSFGNLKDLVQHFHNSKKEDTESRAPAHVRQVRKTIHQALEHARADLQGWVSGGIFVAQDPTLITQLDRLAQENHQLAEEDLLEEQVAAVVLESLSNHQTCNLILANSLSVRLACWIAPAFKLRESCSVFTQRGANGIDGIFAVSAGIALSTQAPTIVLCGDVAASHDLSSLSLLRRSLHPVIALILDNNGGRIFDHLPLSAAAQTNDVWQYFQTPPQINFKAAAEAFDLNYLRVSNVKELRAALAHCNAPLKKPGKPTVIHAQVSGGSSKAFVQKLKLMARNHTYV